MSIGPATGSGFPPNEAALPVTIDSSLNGVGATGVIETDEAGEVVNAVVITAAGSGYKAGETVSLTDSNGLATAVIQETN